MTAMKSRRATLGTHHLPSLRDPILGKGIPREVAAGRLIVGSYWVSSDTG